MSIGRVNYNIIIYFYCLYILRCSSAKFFVFFNIYFYFDQMCYSFIKYFNFFSSLYFYVFIFLICIIYGIHVIYRVNFNKWTNVLS